MTSFLPDRSVVRVQAALSAIAEGRPVIVVDDFDRENEGDLIFAAERATPELLAFMVRHTSGFICVALTGSDCARLDLPPMHHDNDDPYRTAYCVAVDRCDNGTGISARARARTIASLADPAMAADDFQRPGHVVPLRAQEDGVLARRGHTEAAVDLARMAGLHPAGALCEIVSTEQIGAMARGPELERFAAEHGLVMLSIDDLVRYRQSTEPLVQRVVSTSLPTEHGRFHVVGYSGRDHAEHLALIAGEEHRVSTTTPVHVHHECLVGDVLRSQACGCGRELDDAMRRFAAQGEGVVVYLRGEARSCASRTSDLSPVADWILADLQAEGQIATAEAEWQDVDLAAARSYDQVPYEVGVVAQG
ncbi:3,4-dihydroxy-2-butanone-4-phosphate synthase [Saccharopolyspora sp. NPDC049426]|uniref:3,4-dihydroxy-2-butanone-4-phosphate synthase n=1 Tax=Saccharopolyspora sp. NPDC049426 TaxID=3155652 RepID=UPI003430905A